MGAFVAIPQEHYPNFSYKPFLPHHNTLLLKIVFSRKGNGKTFPYTEKDSKLKEEENCWIRNQSRTNFSLSGFCLVYCDCPVISIKRVYWRQLGPSFCLESSQLSLTLFPAKQLPLCFRVAPLLLQVSLITQLWPYFMSAVHGGWELKKLLL